MGKNNHPSTHLRVISGHFRGQILQSPEVSSTHPMGAREKLALFNMIDATGKVTLDLYAGSGALGIEAISRGATEVVFVEKSPKVAHIIAQNLGNLGLEGAESTLRTTMILNGCTIRVLIEDAQKSLLRSEFKAKFDLILADPPYDGFTGVGRVLEDLEGVSGLLTPGGQLVLSSPAEFEPPVIRGMTVTTTHTYARARLTVYVK